MITQLCLLQFIAVAAAPNHKSSLRRPHPVQNATTQIYWAGFVVAAALHLAGFSLLENRETKQTVTPPQPIMVNWIGSLTSVPQPAQLPKTVPNPEQTKPKAHIPTVAKPTKSQPIIAAQGNSSEPITTQTPEPAQTPPKTNELAAVPPSDTSTEAVSEVLSLPNLNANYLNNPSPTYPAQSKQLGEQGKVFLKVLVNMEGTVEQVTLRKSSGHERLDEAAQETVKTWRFVPAKRGSQVIAAWVIVPISFSLEG